jgi:hypothetical protein
LSADTVQHWQLLTQQRNIIYQRNQLPNHHVSSLFIKENLQRFPEEWRMVAGH